MTKQQLARSRVFYETIERAIQNKGLKPNTSLNTLPWLPEYTIETSVGLYTFRPMGRDPTTHLGVFGRFNHSERAKQKYDCNPHNGKWNFYANPRNVTEARMEAEHIMHRIFTA